jgi:EF-P beta-lysylation protein EpmB
MASARISVNSASPAAEPHRLSWREAIKRAIRDPVELCRRLELPESFHRGAIAAAKSFPIFAPLELISRMRKGDPRDPLLRQVLPIEEECTEAPEFVADPVEDRRFQIAPGLLHKYQGRALLIATGACAVHCRYCFRRHFPYDEAPPARELWETAARRLEADPTIEEVILSGGDPLTLVDSALDELVQRLAAVPHLRRLRVHTRLPIVIPQRVTSELLEWLCGSRLTPIVVVHVNHPAEIDAATEAALARLVDAGAPLLNQAVLLRGVNDDADVLTELSQRLIDLRVMPYYLHQLDRVAGAAHFEVSIERGRQLVAELHRRLPGYAVPRYVQEIPGAPGKMQLT